MPYKVLGFVPAYGHMLSAATFLTTHQLVQVLMQNGIGGGFSTMSFPDVAEVREMAVTVWYDTMPDVSHILFIDADMGFPPQLVMDMLGFGEPLVGCLYPQRRIPPTFAGSGTGEAQGERRGNWLRVEGVGMGCTLIHRSVIKTMLERMPEIVDTRIEQHPAKDMIRGAGANRLIRCFEKLDIPDRGVVSEDLSFCIRWNRCGGQTWANIGYKISHVGQHDFAARYLDHVEAQMNIDGGPIKDVRESITPIFMPMGTPSVPMPNAPGAEMPGGPVDRESAMSRRLNGSGEYYYPPSAVENQPVAAE